MKYIIPQKHYKSMNNNSNNYGADKAMKVLGDIAPLLLFITAVLSFISMGVFQFNFYQEELSESLPTVGLFLAGSIAFITQIARIAFGLAGAHDFMRNENLRGILGLAASFGLTVFESFEASWMAEHWNAGSSSYVGLLQFIVWIGFILEVRLILMVSADEKESPDGGASAYGNKEKLSQEEWEEMPEEIRKPSFNLNIAS